MSKLTIINPRRRLSITSLSVDYFHTTISAGRRATSLRALTVLDPAPPVLSTVASDLTDSPYAS